MNWNRALIQEIIHSGEGALEVAGLVHFDVAPFQDALPHDLDINKLEQYFQIAFDLNLDPDRACAACWRRV